MRNQRVPNRNTIIWGDDQPPWTLCIVDGILLVRDKHFQMNEEFYDIITFTLFY